MNLLYFAVNYLLALGYLWVPEDYSIYYVVGMLMYVSLYFNKIKKANIYQDVHPFLLGYGASWASKIFSIMHIENVSFTIVLLIFGYALYRDKRNEDIGLKKEKEVMRRMVYVIVLPLSAFFSILYILQENTIAFLVYYAWLFYAVYESRFLLKSNVYHIFSLMNAVIFMFLVFHYMPFAIIEKGMYLVIFVCMTMWSKKIKIARGS